MNWSLYRSSTWSCVSTLECSSFVICGCSLIYSSISQVRHVSSETDNVSLWFYRLQWISALWLGQWEQCLRTTHSLPPCYSIDVLWGNPTHHIFTDPVSLYTKLNSKLYNYNIPADKNQSIWGDTRLNCFLLRNLWAISAMERQQFHTIFFTLVY